MTHWYYCQWYWINDKPELNDGIIIQWYSNIVILSIVNDNDNITKPNVNDSSDDDLLSHCPMTLSMTKASIMISEKNDSNQKIMIISQWLNDNPGQRNNSNWLYWRGVLCVCYSTNAISISIDQLVMTLQYWWWLSMWPILMMIPIEMIMAIGNYW